VFKCVSFLWNSFISREAATAELRYKKERNAITWAAGLCSISAPPHNPPEDYGQILATSPKVEDGLHFDSNSDHVRIFSAVIGHLEVEIFEFSQEMVKI
jgi:hypothetical protein